MNKKELKSLTWKYFLEQKWEELKGPIIGLAILSASGIFLNCLASANFNPINWQGIIIISIIIIIILTFLFLIQSSLIIPPPLLSL